MPTATVQHSTQTGIELHEDKRIKEPVRAASTANITLSAPGATIDGVTMSAGDRFGAFGQSTASQGGLYVWNGAAVAASRASDAAVAADFVYLFKVGVREGTANGATYWTFTQSAAVTVGTTALTFAKDGGTSFANQSANTVYAGPTSGGAAAPAFRAVVPADVPVMGPSGGSHAAGLVPDPGASTGTTKFLREDATFAVPAGGGGSSSGGTGGSIVPIQTQTPSGTGTATFTVPAGFKNLRFTGELRTSAAVVSTPCTAQFNGDATAGNYDSELLQGATSTASAAANTTAAGAMLVDAPGTSTTANRPGVFEATIFDHAGATFHKTLHSRGGFTADAEDYLSVWHNTAAITSVAIVLASGNFVAGSTITLWGEADTAPVLLTSNSNLIQETILTAAAATIPVPNIPQGYRDLRVEIQARGDGSGSTVTLGLQFNGDTGSNYGRQTFLANNTGLAGGSNSGTYISLGDVVGVAGAANEAAALSIRIPNYSASVFYKQALCSSGNQGNTSVWLNMGSWHNTAAITSLTISPISGNLIAGSAVRVYGEPAAAAGPSVGTGTRLRMSGNQSITTATATALNWDTEDQDADNQHYTSVANLTGTVAKTAASATLTGTGTAFTTELSVGQVISVPGTASEKRVVVAIASATSLTVSSAFVNTASGQTAARVNSTVVFRQPGFYSLEANVYSAALASGAVTLAYYLNSLTTATSGTAIGQRDPVFVNASAGYDLVIQRQFQQWDFVEVVWTQNSGGSVNVLADERTHWSISARPTVIVAVPYINLQDQKAQNTNAGGLTGNTWNTRAINTIASDTAGVCTLASSQFTLSPGWYRTRARAPGYKVGSHQLRLQNITDATTISIPGESAYASTSSDGWSVAELEGKFQLTGTKTLELQHNCGTTQGSNGAGIAANLGTEVYAVVEIWKEG